MTAEEILLVIAEMAQDRGIKFHIENYNATRSQAEKLLRLMSIIPMPLALESKTTELPLYQRGVASYNPRSRF